MAKSVIVSTTLILVMTSQAAFAQNSGLGVNTILEKYYPGETITVYGSIDRIVPQIILQTVNDWRLNFSSIDDLESCIRMT